MVGIHLSPPVLAICLNTQSEMCLKFDPQTTATVNQETEDPWTFVLIFVATVIDYFIWTQITSHTTDRGHDGFNDGVVSSRLLLLPHLRPGPRPVVVLKHLQTSKTDWSVRHNTSSLSFFELSIPPIRTVFWFKSATLRPVSFLGKFRLVATSLIVKMVMSDY